MTARFLINPFEEAERLAQDRGSWIVATVDPQMSWPTRKQIVSYDGRDFVLFPQSTEAEASAGVALRADLYGLDGQSARRHIMRFCSALSWAEGSGIEILTWSGGNIPRPMHVRRGHSIVDYLNAEHLPIPGSDDHKAALALYSEGTSLNNPFYAFLSLYKAISVVFPKGKQRARWIAEALGGLDDHSAKERRDVLQAQNIDVGRYVWEEGRNAVAHAEKRPYVNCVASSTSGQKATGKMRDFARLLRRSRRSKDHGKARIANAIHGGAEG